MKRIILRYKDKSLKINIEKDNTCIIDSYQIRTSKDMEAILYLIRYEAPLDYAINLRNIKDMVREWRSHNLLYSLGILKDRTSSVDLNIEQPWYITMCYYILSFFYLP